MDNMYFTSSSRATGAISEPLYTRTRHRFRGQRESEKFNLEANSFYQSVKILYDNSEAIGGQIDVAGHMFLGNPEYDEAYQYLVDGLNAYLHMLPTHWTPTGEDSTIGDELQSSAYLRDRLKALEARIKNLENG